MIAALAGCPSPPRQSVRRTTRIHMMIKACECVRMRTQVIVLFDTLPFFHGSGLFVLERFLRSSAIFCEELSARTGFKMQRKSSFIRVVSFRQAPLLRENKYHLGHRLRPRVAGGGALARRLLGPELPRPPDGNVQAVQ
eukprot:81304-Pleurochrysis_carterae.AAC.1